MKWYLVLSVFLISFIRADAQDYWTARMEADKIAPDKSVSRITFPQEYKLFDLNRKVFSDELFSLVNNTNRRTTVITLPNADGGFEQFRIVEASNFEPALQARFPGIRSFSGNGLTDKTATLKLSISPDGIQSMVLRADRASEFIEPYSRDNNVYVVFRSNRVKGSLPWRCHTVDQQLENSISSLANSSVLRSGGDLKTMRLAQSVTAEYSNFFGATSNAQEALVLAAVNATMTRVNGVLEIDMAVHLNLINNTTDVFYYDPLTDPYSPANIGAGGAWNGELQATLTAEIGEANYDIGHLFGASGGGGNAGCIGCICVDGQKGSGYTSPADGIPQGDNFDIDYVVHEMGHQMGANHTFSHANEGTGVNKEVGSGITIMGYAGITSQDVDDHSIAIFHQTSIEQIQNNLAGKTCPVTTSLAGVNNTPTANAGANYTIPRSTPFALTGSASDDGEALTYCWEQNDNASNAQTGAASIASVTKASGPNWLSFMPSSSARRVFPTLATILAGGQTTGPLPGGDAGVNIEALSSVSRTLNFRLTVRDNAPFSSSAPVNVGQTQFDDMVVTVDGAKGPFAVTTPNSAVSWCPGAQTINWSVNGSETLATDVRISLSYDGGNTFPVILAASTPNDGSHSVNIPCTYSTTARIMIEGLGNIFFDISDANITVGDNTKPTFTVPANITINKDANCNYDANVSITGDVTDEDDNCDNSLDATFVDATAPGSCDGETIITRTWTLTDDCGNSTVKIQTITVTDVTAPTFNEPADITIYKDQNCNHDASVAVTGDVTDEDDNCDNTLDAIYSDVTVPGTCIGHEIITRTWTLSDDCGNSVSKIQIIDVRDTTRPAISNVSATPNVLWPPNHKMRNVVINYTAVDNCSPVTNVLTIESDEPINGTGDGDTAPDWEVIDDHNIRLRAERAGNGDGRVYTITITSTDDCGNVATTTTTVIVPHNNSMTVRGVTEVYTGLTVKVMPNPTRDNFTIQLTSPNKEKIQIGIYDMFGRKIEERVAASDDFVSFGDNYPAGNYVLRISQGMEKQQIKVVKLK